MTYYDRLNKTYRAFEQMKLQPAAQLTMLHLLHMNNCFGNTGLFYCTDDKLASLTNLSKDSITNAKRHLKNAGLIDFKSNPKKPRQGTLYILPDEQGKEQGKEQGNEQGKEQGKTRGVVSDSFIKNKEKEKEKETPAPAHFITGLSPEVQEMWFKCEGEQIPGSVALKLYELEKLHSTDVVVKAIETASLANSQPRLSFNFVKAVLERQLKGNSRNDKCRRNDGDIVDNSQYAGADFG